MLQSGFPTGSRESIHLPDVDDGGVFPLVSAETSFGNKQASGCIVIGHAANASADVVAGEEEVRGLPDFIGEDFPWRDGALSGACQLAGIVEYDLAVIWPAMVAAAFVAVASAFGDRWLDVTLRVTAGFIAVITVCGSLVPQQDDGVFFLGADKASSVPGESHMEKLG